MKHPLSLAIASALRPTVLRRCALATAMGCGVMPAIALAATATAGEGAIQQLDGIEVSAPILASQSQSIEVQRESINVVNAIASDAIGQFPDTTAAGALARLPAIAVQRDQGQERYIQVRGAPARWTSVAFDGINVVGADERIFRFDSVPAALIDVVAVSKTLTPAMPADALAGRVDIQTVSPMASRGLAAQGSIGYGPMELGDGAQRQVDGRVSWSNDSFGILVGASTYSRDQLTDNREYAYDADGLPESFDFRSYQLQRETNSGMAKLEWRPADGHHLSLQSLYTEFKDHEYRNQYVFDVGSALGGTRGIDAGQLVGVPVTASLQDGRYGNSTSTSTLAGDHQLDVWTLGWAVNYTETESTTDLPLLQQRQTSPTSFVSLDYDRTDPRHTTLRLYDTLAGAAGFTRGTARPALDQTAFGLDLLVPIDVGTLTEATTVKFDASRDLDIADGARLTLGMQVDNRDADGNTFDGLGAVLVSPYAAALGLDWDVDPYITGDRWQSGFPRGFDVNYVDNAGLRRHLDAVLAQLQAAGLYDPATAISPTSRFSITEDVLAGYAMLEVVHGRHKLLGGVRVEQADTTSSGFLLVDGDAVPTRASERRTDVLPSIHWNFDLRDDLKLRNALVTGLARPGFGQLRASAGVDDAGRSITGGNPNLDPETAWGVDSSLEWYFAEASIASLGLFHRDVSDVLFSSTTTVDDTRFDGGGISRQGYDYVTTLNGGDGELSGLELNYQQRFTFLPGALDGFGAQVNLALLDGQFQTPEGREVAFPGTSRRVLNTSLYYEKYGLSVRLAYQWRDRWLDDVSVDSSGDFYWDDTEQLDLSARYFVNRNLTLFLDANNLTNEEGVRYQGDRSRPVEVEGFGRRYMAGLRVNF
jgi:TonB-dependent receptor